MDFWGLEIIPNKLYSQEVEAAFKISMAVFGPNIVGEERSTITLKVDDNQFVLCHLIPNKTEQQILDVVIDKGQNITFSVAGKNSVNLIGNLVPELNDYEMEDDDYSDEDEECYDEECDEFHEGNASYAIISNNKPGSSPKIAELKENENIDKVFQKETPATTADDTSSISSDEELSDDKVQERPSSEEEQIEESNNKYKKAKKEIKDEIKDQSNKLQITDVRVGKGKEVKNGLRVSVHYVGKLKSNGKVIDKSKTPFQLTVGDKGIIKGWNLSLVGMKEGGIRKVVIPSDLGYGKKGVPPRIPSNADLEFELRLLKVFKN